MIFFELSVTRNVELMSPLLIGFISAEDPNPKTWIAFKRFLSEMLNMTGKILRNCLLKCTFAHQTIAGLFLFYYAAFFLYMLSINAANVRTAMRGISLNLVTLFTSLIPLVAVFFYYSVDSIRASIDYNGVAYHQWVQTRNTRYLIAEIAGVVVFIILLEPLFKKLYRKWYALPEN